MSPRSTDTPRPDCRIPDGTVLPANGDNALRHVTGAHDGRGRTVDGLCAGSTDPDTFDGHEAASSAASVNHGRVRRRHPVGGTRPQTTMPPGFGHAPIPRLSVDGSDWDVPFAVQTSGHATKTHAKYGQAIVRSNRDARLHLACSVKRPRFLIHSTECVSARTSR